MGERKERERERGEEREKGNKQWRKKARKRVGVSKRERVGTKRVRRRKLDIEIRVLRRREIKESVIKR